MKKWKFPGLHFLSFVQSSIAKVGLVGHSRDNVSNVDLCKLKPTFREKTKLIARPWFWVPQNKVLGKGRCTVFSLSLFSMLMQKSCSTHQQNRSGWSHFMPERFDIKAFKRRKISVHPHQVNILQCLLSLPHREEPYLQYAALSAQPKMSRRYREKCTEKWHEINFSFLRILLPAEAIYHL